MVNSDFEKLTQNATQVLGASSLAFKLGFTTIIAGGHALIEDIPGVGKTTLVTFLGKIFDLKFKRIQFTNDLLPSDVLGTNIYVANEGKFQFKPGPIFCQLLLADELNRAPSKTQSALLQAMEEKKISIDGIDYDLGEDFTVLATQNPYGMQGTFVLPESQLDRFMVKFSMGFPDPEIEKKIILEEVGRSRLGDIEKTISAHSLKNWKTKVNEQAVTPKILDYILGLIKYTRSSSQMRPLSPRFGQDLLKFAKAWSLINGGQFVTADDVKFVFPFVAGHRLINKQASLKSEQEVSELVLKNVNVY